MSAPSISVVIPTFNYAHLLPRAIGSVLSQWDDQIELIVINDGSTDNTRDVLNTLVSGDARINAITQANAGAAAARNAGIAKARGEFILLLDADDELCSDAIAVLLDSVRRFPDVGLFIGSHISVFSDGQERLRQVSVCSHMSQSERVQGYLLTKRISISHGCTLFRRSLLLDRPYPANLRNGEDIPVFAFCLALGPVVSIDAPLAKIYKHGDSLRHSAVSHPEDHISTLINATFERLPLSCQSLKPHYAAKRWQSLARERLKHGDRKAGLKYFFESVSLSKSQSFQWRNFRKFLSAFFRSYFRRAHNS